MPPITSELLERLAPNDFSVVPKDNVLVLVYPQDGRDQEMYQILHEHQIEVQILQEKQTNRHVIEIYFPKTDDVMRLVFNKTEDNYPLRQYANSGIIRSISAGIFQGDQTLYINPSKSLDIKLGGQQNN
jgi:hypothetical protein